MSELNQFVKQLKQNPNINAEAVDLELQKWLENKSESLFYSDDIYKLSYSKVYNVLCRHTLKGLYCYGFLNPKTGKLTTGYEFETGDDLHIELDQKFWISKPVNNQGILI